MPSDSEDSIDWDSLPTCSAFDKPPNDAADRPPAPQPNAPGANGDHPSNGTSTPTASTVQPSSAAGSTQLLVNGLAAPDSPDAFIDRITHHASTPVSLLVESLVQQLCSMIDSDPHRSTQLYLRICEQLHQMRLIDRTYAMGEFELMRSQYQRALYQLVSVARGHHELPLPVQSVWPLTQPVGMDWSRYHREFDELAFVAGGGFGKVFRARHKLDGIEYAVKKVNIRSITIGRILTHLAEVKTLAGLNHQNVVAYKAAWLEPLLSDPGAEEPDDDGAASTASRTQRTFDATADSQPSVSFTADSAVSCSIAMDESSEFIQFADSSQTVASAHISSAASHSSMQMSRFTAGGVPAPARAVFNEAQSPHLNLQWATLYIQMTLCQMTLREWLDERNASADFGAFFARFRQRFSGSDTATDLVRPSFGDAALDIVRQLLAGLQYIHSRGIIHHDVKPSNVFVGLTADGQLSVQLGDFGLACPLQDASHRDDSLIGTPTYAAPEQLRGCCDPKSDVFSVGVVWLELLVPFGTDMERIRSIERVRSQQVPDGFPPMFAGLLLSIVALDPIRRPSTTEILAELARIAQDQHVHAAQQQVEALTAELQRLRTELRTHPPAADAPASPSLREQLTSKDDAIRAKNNEIHRLQRQIAVMRRTAVELRSKDAEIRRLRAALQRRSVSRSDSLGAGTLPDELTIDDCRMLSDDDDEEPDDGIVFAE